MVYTSSLKFTKLLSSPDFQIFDITCTDICICHNDYVILSYTEISSQKF